MTSLKSNSDNSPAHIIVPSDNVNSLSTSDNINKHNHIHHHNHSTIISSFSEDTIPSNNFIPQAVSPNTRTNTETEGLHHPSTIIRSTLDNTEGNTNTNDDLQTGTSTGVKSNNNMRLNMLSGGSSTIAENNLGIHIDNLAQKIINDVKNKLEKQGINIH